MKEAGWWRNQKGEWYVVWQLGLFVLVAFGPRALPGLPLWSGTLAQMSGVVGWLLTAVGLALAFWGIRSLGDNITAVPKPKESAQLVEVGAYRIVRHPIYSGIILTAVGWAGVRHSTLVLLYALLLFLFFDIKSRREELWLTEKYPNYPAYQANVRKLIPFLY